MRTRSSLAAVAAVAALALAGAGSAVASAQPHAGGPVLTKNGAAVAVGDVVTAPLASKATFYSSPGGTTGVTCTTSQFTAKVTSNPTSPGVAGESLTGQTFSNCTANVVGVTGVQSVTVTSLPMATTVSDASGFPVVVGGTVTTTVVLNTLLGTTSCNYTGGPLTGNASNTGSTITFASQHFTKSSGSSLCFADAYFTATYGPVTDGGLPVTVN